MSQCAIKTSFDNDYELDDLESSIRTTNPDEYADSSRLDYADRRRRLENILDEMTTNDGAWFGSPISAEACNTAKRFLWYLPATKELPKVAPEGDGDVLLVWEPPHGDCVVTVQNATLYLIAHPGSANAEYVDDQPFIGEHIPVSILQAIPMK